MIKKKLESLVYRIVHIVRRIWLNAFFVFSKRLNSRLLHDRV